MVFWLKRCTYVARGIWVRARSSAMIAQMRLTSCGISVNAPITKTSAELGHDEANGPQRREAAGRGQDQGPKLRLTQEREPPAAAGQAEVARGLSQARGGDWRDQRSPAGLRRPVVTALKVQQRLASPAAPADRRGSPLYFFYLLCPIYSGEAMSKAAFFPPVGAI